MAPHPAFNDTTRPVNRKQMHAVDRCGGWVSYGVYDAAAKRSRTVTRARHLNTAFLWNTAHIPKHGMPAGPGQHLQLSPGTSKAMANFFRYINPVLATPDSCASTEPLEPHALAADFQCQLFAALGRSLQAPSSTDRNAAESIMASPWYAVGRETCQWFDMLTADHRDKPNAASSEVWPAIRDRMMHSAKSYFRTRSGLGSAADIAELFRMALQAEQPTGRTLTLTILQIVIWLIHQWPVGPPDLQGVLLWTALQEMVQGLPEQVRVEGLMRATVDTKWCWTSRVLGGESRQEAELCERQVIARLAAQAWNHNIFWPCFMRCLPIHSDQWLELAILANAVHPTATRDIDGNPERYRLWSHVWSKFCRLAGFRAQHDPLRKVDEVQTRSMRQLNPDIASHRRRLNTVQAFQAKPPEQQEAEMAALNRATWNALVPA